MKLYCCSKLLVIALIVVAVNCWTHTPRYMCIGGYPCNGFWEYLPNSYNASTSTKHPTIIFFHGLGDDVTGNGREPEINKVLTTAIPKVINEGRWPTSWDFIVISPQDFIGWWGATRSANVINIVLDKYPKVDPDRVYITGLSAGGAAVWEYGGSGIAAALKVAAVVPICGANANPTAAQVSNYVATNLPVWAFHNSGDTQVRVSNTNNWINGLTAGGLNPVPKKTIYEAGGHDAWTRTYDPSPSNPNNIYAWFLTHSRANSVSTVAPTVAPTTTPTVAPTTTPCPSANIGTGVGLRGVYYSGTNFTTAVGARVDSIIDFSYPSGTAPSIPTLSSTNYSVRWTGTIRAKFTGAHTFYTNSDDGVRLKINTATIIDNWTDHGVVENSGVLSLLAGTTYNLVLEHYNSGSGARISLSWSASCLAKEVIPTSQLTPGALNICS